MKPADRALEIAVVGLGQAGGNIATEFARLGYRALALNTAHTDLSSLGPGQRAFALAAEQRIYVGLDGYDGAGADLNYGRECLQENAERIRDAVASHCDGADLLLLSAGLGGGTGSSVSELVRILKDLDVPIITLATLPNEYESGIAKVNAVRAVSDLVKQPGVGWVFADNSRLSQIYGGVSLDEYFEKVNSVIVKPLDALNRLNARTDIQPIRTLDGEDFRALLLSTGVINYAENTLSELSVDAVTERVRDNLSASSMMPAGFAPEEISYMGVILEASEDVLKETPFTFFEQLNEQLKDETGGGAIYMGVYRAEQPTEGGAATLRMIASTQSLPEGVQAMVNDARREGGTLRDKLQRSMSALDLGEIEEFDLFKTSLRTSQPSHGRRRQANHSFAVPEPVVARSRKRASQSAPADNPAGEPDPEPDPESNPVAPVESVVAPPPSPAEQATSAEAEHAVAEEAPPESDSAPEAELVDDDDAVEELAPYAIEDVTEVGDDLEGLTASDSGADLQELSADALVDEGEDPDSDAPATDSNAPSSEDSLQDRDAEAAAYSKLVSTFLRTDFDSTRSRVARRLDGALKSDDSVTRKLAEQALERIESAGKYELFTTALGKDGGSSPSP